jgi:hypothetical protein
VSAVLPVKNLPASTAVTQIAEIAAARYDCEKVKGSGGKMRGRYGRPVSPNNLFDPHE